MKTLKSILLIGFLSILPYYLSASTIHIWIKYGNEDYSWENALQNELQNSKYNYRFGKFQYTGDYAIDLVLFKNDNLDTQYGTITLYKVQEINKRNELLFRRSYVFIYALEKKYHGLWI